MAANIQDDEYGSGRHASVQVNEYWTGKHWKCLTWSNSNNSYDGLISISFKGASEKEVAHPAYWAQYFYSGVLIVVLDSMF